MRKITEDRERRRDRRRVGKLAPVPVMPVPAATPARRFAPETCIRNA